MRPHKTNLIIHTALITSLGLPIAAHAQDVGLIITGINALFNLGSSAKQISNQKAAQAAQIKAQAELQTRTDAAAVEQAAKQVVRDQKIADYKTRGWMPITESPNDTQYINGNDLQLSDDEVVAWLKTNFTKPLTTHKKVAKSSIFNVRYDCKNRTVHNEQATYYANKDGKGHTIAPVEFFPPMDVSRVVPESAEAKALDFACALR